MQIFREFIMNTSARADLAPLSRHCDVHSHRVSYADIVKIVVSE